MLYFSAVKSFWPVQNNKPVIDATKKLKKRNKAMSIATCYFPTLYINILYNKQKYDVKIELINFCFKGGKKLLIAVAKFGATWTDNKITFNVTFDKASLKLGIKLGFTLL